MRVKLTSLLTLLSQKASAIWHFLSCLWLSGLIRPALSSSHRSHLRPDTFSYLLPAASISSSGPSLVTLIYTFSASGSRHPAAGWWIVCERALLTWIRRCLVLCFSSLQHGSAAPLSFPNFYLPNTGSAFVQISHSKSKFRGNSTFLHSDDFMPDVHNLNAPDSMSCDTENDLRPLYRLPWMG